jgi:hypothetical protein
LVPYLAAFDIQDTREFLVAEGDMVVIHDSYTGSSTKVRFGGSHRRGRKRPLPALTSTGSRKARSWNTGSTETLPVSCNNWASRLRQGPVGARRSARSTIQQVQWRARPQPSRQAWGAGFATTPLGRREPTDTGARPFVS